MNSDNQSIDEIIKYGKVANEMAAIEEFLDWLSGRGYYLARVDGSVPRIKPLLDEYFGIDARKLEQERRALLREERERQEATSYTKPVSD